MKYGQAIAIIKNLDKHTEEEIGAAIYKIIEMPTINAVNKDSLRDIIKYLFDLCYEIDKGGAE